MCVVTEDQTVSKKVVTITTAQRRHFIGVRVARSGQEVLVMQCRIEASEIFFRRARVRGEELTAVLLFQFRRGGQRRRRRWQDGA